MRSSPFGWWRLDLPAFPVFLIFGSESESVEDVLCTREERLSGSESGILDMSTDSIGIAMATKAMKLFCRGIASDEVI